MHTTRKQSYAPPICILAYILYNGKTLKVKRYCLSLLAKLNTACPCFSRSGK